MKNRTIHMRITEQEREDLIKRAGEITVSAYMHNLLFPNASTCKTKAKRKKTQPIISIENTVNVNEVPFVVFQGSLVM